MGRSQDAACLSLLFPNVFVACCIKSACFYKTELIILGSHKQVLKVKSGIMQNACSPNYLGSQVKGLQD